MPPPLLSAPLTAALMPLESTMREPTKSSITFILHDGDDGEFQAEDTKIIKEEATEDGDERVVGRAARPVPRVIAPAAARARAPVKMARKAGVSGTSEKRKARCCTVDGCENYTINRGLCFRHGGGKRCSMEDCTASAKHAGLCWKHGGSVKCIVEGCDRRGKSRGFCWAHGGGTKCGTDGCNKVAVSNGCCWAHGGGKRCSFRGCRKAAYERTHNFCVQHHELLREGQHTVEL